MNIISATALQQNISGIKTNKAPRCKKTNHDIIGFEITSLFNIISLYILVLFQ